MDDLIVAADTMSWWAFLCVVSALNVLAWVASAVVLRHSRDALHHEVWNSRRLQLLLSAGYVAGCAYRSALPVYDVQRLCLVDSWLSSVIVGRSVATVAELWSRNGPCCCVELRRLPTARPAWWPPESRSR